MYTSNDISLSVLDQIPIRKESSASDALNETINLAVVCDNLGYQRYWVAEHHNSKSFTGNSPEILITAIAEKTNHIRVGSGGVMLTHYSSLKIAEQFLTLQALHPNRIDLGIGRAPGSDQKTSTALSYPRNQINVEYYPAQVIDLINYVNNSLAEDHPFKGVQASADTNTPSSLDIWLLGSSDYSARLAATLGLPFAFADFFGDLPHGPIVADLYRRTFKPSKYLKNPLLTVAVQALCATTEEEALFLGSSRNLNKASSVMGLHQAFISPEEATQYPLTEQAEQFMKSFRKGYIDGNPKQVAKKILNVANKYKTNEIAIVTNAYSHEVRIQSYTLIANEFNLAELQS